MKYLLTGFTAFLLFLTAVGTLSAQDKDSVDGDLEALIDLYSATNGDNWDNKSGWLNGNPSNEWYGVEVNSNGRVIKLDLYKNNLSGELPESIGNLSKLQFFSVKGNPIYSKIPKSIGNWVDAEFILFSSHQGPKVAYNEPVNNNHHPGKTPSASVAKYYGKIPNVFDKLPNLEAFEVSWATDLDPQPFPSTLYQHSTLRHLVLNAVKLEGELLNEFNLPKLELLYLGSNSLTGSIPSSLGNSVLLEKLYFSISDAYESEVAGKLTGSIPASFANLVNMQRFFLQNQNLSGEIPGFIVENWLGLREINLKGNNFTGEIPKEFGNFNLIIFDFSNNNFSGSLHPNLVSGMQNVIIFSVRNNNLTGNLPNGQMVNGEWKGWRTKTRLRTWVLGANNFTGPLPDMPEYVGDMSLVIFSGNQFEGSIPDTWRELFTPSLRDDNPRRVFNLLRLNGNNLQGIIPEWFTASNGPTDYLGGNKWAHKDILENSVDVKLDSNPAKSFGHAITKRLAIGDAFEFDYSHKVHSADRIKWSKYNDSLGEWNEDERFNGKAVLEIANIQESDYGSYRMELYNKNTPLPDWVYSELIVIEEGEESKDSSGTTDDAQNSFPNAPVLYGPDDDSDNVSITPEFVWSDIEADYYILHVSRLDPTGMSIDVIVEDTTFIPSDILGDGSVHDWRVRGVKDGEMGSWSDIRRFTTREEGLPAMADLVSPGHFAQEVDPTTQLEWEDVSADLYEIRLTNKTTSEILFSDVSASNSFIAELALPDTTEFIWQVKSIINGVHGAWGPRWEFSTGIYEYNVESPSLITPVQGAEYDNLTPVFEWSQVDADHYVIIVTKEAPSPAKTLSGLQNETLVILDESKTTEYTPQSPLDPETLYYWRVQAVKDGEEGEWSEVWEFRTADVETSVSVGDGFEKPIDTALQQNYPNPFNPSTQIEFTLNEMKRVSLSVYDMAGREVALLVDEVLSAGSHVRNFKANNLSSGVYIYRLVAGNNSYTKKMTLIK